VRLARNLGQSNLAELRRLAREGYVFRVAEAANLIGRKPPVIWRHAAEGNLGRSGPNGVRYLHADEVKDLREQLKPYDARATTPADPDGEWGRHGAAIGRAKGKKVGPRRQLAEEEIGIIREGLAAGDSYQTIAADIGDTVTVKQVQGIARAPARTRDRRSPGRPPREVSTADRAKVLQLVGERFSLRAIARITGVPVWGVRQIKQSAQPI
jgi:hypothetical protein